jgi:hypothetical protein
MDPSLENIALDTALLVELSTGLVLTAARIRDEK